VAVIVSGRARTLVALAALVAVPASCARRRPGPEPPKGEAGGWAGSPRPERSLGAGGTPVVCTTTYPLKYFAERIGRGKVRVLCPVPSDEASLLRDIDAQAIRAYQTADLIVTNGAGFDDWVSMASVPESRLVDTSRPFEDELIELETVTHSHGPCGAHSHGGIDGHTWLDPVLAKAQAEEIRRAMASAFPDDADEFEKGFSSLAADLGELDRLLAGASEAYDGRPIVASHPSYNYLARRYGWKVVNPDVDLDPATAPGAAEIEAVRDAVAGRPARLILWERLPRGEAAKALEEELGLRSVVFSTCEDEPGGLDYVEVMKGNAERIRQAFAAAGRAGPSREHAPRSLWRGGRRSR
jgi:zinc transport system substrate-binding protein